MFIRELCELAVKIAVRALSSVDFKSLLTSQTSEMIAIMKNLDGQIEDANWGSPLFVSLENANDCRSLKLLDKSHGLIF